jgi:SAM-dependent methyltransferase
MIKAAHYHGSLHLDEAQLQPPLAGCPFCRGTGLRRLFALQEQPRVDLRACDTCGAASASRMPTDTTLTQYYSRYYTETTAQAHVTVDSVPGFAAHLARLAAAALPSSPRAVLDFGGGDGSIGIALADRLGRSHPVEEVVVVDLSDEPLTRGRTPARRQPGLDDLAPGTFDVVLASAILEHLPAPREVLGRLLELAAPGGVFYARTPFVAPLLRVTRRLGLEVEFCFPGHLHDLGPRFWNQVIEVIGPVGRWRVLVSRPSPVETSLRVSPLRTIAAHVAKAPWRLLGNRYPFVGGWEIMLARDA